MKYVQCLLSKNFDDHKLYIVSWIPKNYAIIGKTLKLKNDDGVWNFGWIVKEMFTEAEEEFILEHERDWAKQRRASDI
jgi:hypothetical protein